MSIWQAEADADSLIVSNALFLTESRQPIVVGTDTYLLLMMIAQATEDMVLHILFCENPTTLYIESTVFKTYTSQYWKDQQISLGITCHYWVWYRVCCVPSGKAESIKFGAQETGIWSAESVPQCTEHTTRSTGSRRKLSFEALWFLWVCYTGWILLHHLQEGHQQDITISHIPAGSISSNKC